MAAFCASCAPIFFLFLLKCQCSSSSIVARPCRIETCRENGESEWCQRKGEILQQPSPSVDSRQRDVVITSQLQGAVTVEEIMHLCGACGDGDHPNEFWAFICEWKGLNIERKKKNPINHSRAGLFPFECALVCEFIFFFCLWIIDKFFLLSRIKEQNLQICQTVFGCHALLTVVLHVVACQRQVAYSWISASTS